MPNAPAQSAPEERTSVLAPGTVFGRYEIVRCIGVGGMGCVYEATHTMLKKKVALKTLHPSFTAQFDARARFLREGETLARVQHPNVVDVTDVGVHGGTFFLVMEMLDGENLRSLLERRGRFDEKQAVGLVLPVIAGVAAAHRAGVVHRDIKPENVILARDPKGDVTPKVVDFGISKEAGADPAVGITQGHAVLGTPCYMSPEQAHGSQDLGVRSDQYSLGVLLYEVFTGRLPFPQTSLVHLMNAIATGTYTPIREARPDVSKAFEAIVTRAMSIHPEDRFESTEALGLALLPLASARVRATYERELGVRVPDSMPPPSIAPARQIETPPAVPAESMSATLAAPVKSTGAPDGRASTTTPATPQHAPTMASTPSGVRASREIVSDAPVVTAGSATPSRRPPVAWFVGAGLVVVVALGTGYVLSMQDGAHATTARPAPVAPARYTLSVRAAPASAQLVLDGQAGAVGSITRELARDGREHELVITAEGHEPRAIRFRDAPPSEALVALTPKPTAPTPVVATPTPADPVPPTVEPRVQRVRRTGAATRTTGPTTAPDPGLDIRLTR